MTYVILASLFTVLVLWKRMMLFVLAAVGFWIASLSFFLDLLSDGVIKQQVVLSIGAVVSGIFLYYMMGKRSTPIDGNASVLTRALGRINGEEVAPRDEERPETAEEYQLRVRQALRGRRPIRR